MLMCVDSSWWLITWFGRRTIYVTGMALLTVVLMLIGILNVSAGDNALWPSGGLCILWLLIYSMTIGPIAVSPPNIHHSRILELLTRGTV